MTDVEKLILEKLGLIESNMATKEGIQIVKMELYDELNRQYKENDKRFTKLESLSNTLIVQSDNTALLLKLITKQSEELEVLKQEVQNIKKKLA